MRARIARGLLPLEVTHFDAGWADLTQRVHVGKENRKYARQTLRLNGRMLLADQTEAVCTTLDITPDGLSITSTLMPYRGQKVIAYIDQIGRIEGTVVRVSRETQSFAISMAMTLRKKAQIAATVAQIAESEVANADSDSFRPGIPI